MQKGKKAVQKETDSESPPGTTLHRNSNHTPASHRAACREALAAARIGERGDEHKVQYSGITYIADGLGGATRLEQNDDGGLISERTIPAKKKCVEY